MNTLEYSNLHLHLLGTPHVTQMVQLLVLDHLRLGYNPPIHLRLGYNPPIYYVCCNLIISKEIHKVVIYLGIGDQKINMVSELAF
jgi:hypothetical protein